MVTARDVAFRSYEFTEPQSRGPILFSKTALNISQLRPNFYPIMTTFVRFLMYKSKISLLN